MIKIISTQYFDGAPSGRASAFIHIRYTIDGDFMSAINYLIAERRFSGHPSEETERFLTALSDEDRANLLATIIRANNLGASA